MADIDAKVVLPSGHQVHKRFKEIHPGIFAEVVSVDGLTLEGAEIEVTIDPSAIANGAATAPEDTPEAGSELDLIGKLLATASVSSASILSLQTAATGTNWATFADTPGRMIDIQNDTGTDIEYRRGGSGASMRIPDGSGRSTWLLANADEISIRRVDTSNSQVTISAEVLG